MDRLDTEHFFGAAPPRSEGSTESRQVATVDHATDESLLAPVIPRPGYFRYKHMVEALLAALILVAGLPIMIAVSLVIAVFDGRPIFYRQERVGAGGRRFRIWKFRTMRRDAENFTGPVWSTTQDPRVTRLGRWLRRSHLDEFPQLFNVVAGDMNIIGPRPERPEFVNELKREIAHYEDRLSVRPGITGLAQVMQGYDRCLADVRRKVDFDCEYIDKACLRMDMRIALQTIPYVMFKLLNRDGGAEAGAMPTQPADPLHLQPTCDRNSTPATEKALASEEPVETMAAPTGSTSQQLRA